MKVVVDLYLLHWRGTITLAETIEAFMALQQAGKIGYVVDRTR